MTDMLMYYLTDSNNPINTLFCCDKLDTIINEFLFHIGNIFDSFIMNNITLHIDGINISNFKIVEAIDSKFGMPCILNIYELNIKTMYFQTLNVGNSVIHIPQHLHFIKNNVQDKLNKITSNVTIKLARNNIINNNSGKQIHNFNDGHLVKKLDELDNLDCVNIENIEKTMNELLLMKNQEKQRLEEIQKELEQRTEILEEKINGFGDRKRDLNKENEREQNRRNKFVANKEAYFRIKKDIHEGKFNEANIPELFEKEYVIYKFMDDENLLNDDDEYMIFTHLYDELNESVEPQTKPQYIPHNINYLNDAEKEKYLNANVSVAPDIVESFIEHRCSGEYAKSNDKIKPNEQNQSSDTCVSEKKYPSLDNILKIVDDTDNAITL